VMIVLMLLRRAIGVCLRLSLGAASAAARMRRTRLRCSAADVVAAAAVVPSNHLLRGGLW
jgi:hypothetical protein